MRRRPGDSPRTDVSAALTEEKSIWYNTTETAVAELTVAELAVAELAGAAGAYSCMEVIRWSSLVAKMKYRS